MFLFLDQYNVSQLGTRSALPTPHTIAAELTLRIIDIFEQKYQKTFKQMSKWSLVSSPSSFFESRLSTTPKSFGTSHQPNTNQNHRKLNKYRKGQNSWELSQSVGTVSPECVDQYTGAEAMESFSTTNSSRRLIQHSQGKLVSLVYL